MSTALTTWLIWIAVIYFAISLVMAGLWALVRLVAGERRPVG